MKKESFKTKLTKRQKRNDILVFLGVMVFSYIFTLWFIYAIGLWEDVPLSEILFLGFFLTYLVISMLILPVMIAAVALGMQKGRAQRVRDDATFVPVQNMEYYRDSLKELNPALVSILIDLDISGKNDIVATLLRMQNKKVIAINETGRLGLNEEKADQLDVSERELLEMIKRDKLNNKTSLSRWKENRFSEAEQQGYIRKKDTRRNKALAISILIWLICLVIGIFVWVTYMKGYERGDNTSTLLRSFIYLTVVDILLFVPLHRLFKLIGMRKRGDVLWERTELGNEAAGKIAALRRFIHDFSMLSTAEKEEALLWEDYLVYAIVLEDNKKIVKDISKQFNIKLSQFDRLRSFNIQR